MKQTLSLPYMILGLIFCVCLITANLLETKLIQLGPYSATAGLLVFPISYVINDTIVEVWGFRKAHLVIWMGFGANLFVVLMGLLAVALPPPPYWEGGEHFNFVFALAPRILVGSLSAFLVGSLINAYIMSFMKQLHRGRYFSLRAILSTVGGETVDSLIFFPIAFGGLIPLHDLVRLMVVQVVLKTLYEVLVLPVTVRVVRRMRALEGIQTDDAHLYL